MDIEDCLYFYLFIESVEIHVRVGVRSHFAILGVVLLFDNLILWTRKSTIAIEVSFAIVLVLFKAGNDFVNLVE